MLNLERFRCEGKKKRKKLIKFYCLENFGEAILFESSFSIDNFALIEKDFKRS